MVCLSGGAGRTVYHYGTHTMSKPARATPGLTADQARKIADAMRPYGWELSATTGNPITRAGTLIKGVRFQPMKGAKTGDHVEAVVCSDDRLLWSGRPENVGSFLHRFYNAERVHA